MTPDDPVAPPRRKARVTSSPFPDPMPGIEGIGHALGHARVDNVAAGKRWGKTPEFIENKLGFLQLRRMNEAQSVLSLCEAAFADLAARHTVDASDCECLIVITQNPEGGHALPHISARLHGALGLPPSAAAFDLGLGCSGYIYGLSVACSFMQVNGLRQGLLFTADPYSSILDPADANTQLLFGDAATCTLLSHTPAYRLGRSCFATDGSRADALRIRSDGLLEMRGRDIYDFSMRAVPRQIRQCLELNHLEEEDVDCLLLHQASRFIVDSIGRRLAFPHAVVPFPLSDVGNCVSSSLPLALNRLEKRYGAVLMSGFGVGLSWGSTMLFRT